MTAPRTLRDVVESFHPHHADGKHDEGIDAAVAAILASAEIAALLERVAALEKEVGSEVHPLSAR